LLASLSESERAEVLKGLSGEQHRALHYDWKFIARPNQLLPPGDWQFWLLLAGRGFGKTKTGGETVREWAKEPLPAPIHIVAPTTADIRDVMIEGPAGILSAYPPGEAPEYQPSKRHRLTWPNGNMALGFSADEPQRLRGPQCCRFWADELCAWRFAQDAWDNLMMGFRIGSDLRGVITTTPKPTKLLREIIADPGTHVTRATTYDNRPNLAKAFFERIIRKYEGTRLGRQELMAEVLDDIPGALWTRAMIDANRIRLQDVRWDLVTRIVVAIDPAVTKGEESNETGIIVAALTRSQHVLVLDDGSCKDTPKGWAQRAVNLFHQWKADRIVAEVNNGGDLVAANIASVAPLAPFRSVRASRGKKKRFEPVASLYEQGRVHHVGFFPDDRQTGRHGLETQMCEWTPVKEDENADDDQEDDRIDALAWAIHELVFDLEQQSEKIVLGDPRRYSISPV
jgi:phage terminase large subunit-like protein